ncbi:hypothetical protein EMCRGX_G006574 [Ephydatia muelleri]
MPSSLKLLAQECKILGILGKTCPRIFCWDLEYREQEEAFRRYREDSQLAAKENHETIARLKEENEVLKKVIELYLREPLSAESSATLPEELCHHEKHLSGGTEQYEQKQDIECMDDSARLKVYQEDFTAERREKESLKEEKENERLRLQAEVTSLQLQLDRCRTELSHYSSETTRLAHQLKIRC